jgi:hypothetical protein
MLNCMTEQAREEEIFSREDTPTGQRIESSFLYTLACRIGASRR